MADHQIHEVAESLLSSVSQQRSMSHSQSVNLVLEELAVGGRLNGGMSSVRRFFCLLATFDLLFTSLVWLICILLPGGNLADILMSEVVHYSMKSSLFDIVIVAACRFIVLILFYGCLHINNWSVVALSTSCTCGFLIAKVFLYNWVGAAQPVYHVFLILTSFTLAWGEAWFLDLRVLPQERQARYLLGAMGAANASERTPLLGARSGGLTCGASTADWFSPINSPDASPKPRRPLDPYDLILTCDRIEEYKRIAESGIALSWRILNSSAGWKLEKRGAIKGDVVQSASIHQHGKVFRFSGVVDCPAKWLYEDLRDNFLSMPDWNPTILKCHLIKELSPGLEIAYQITAGGGGGLVTARDFVMLRRLCKLSASGDILAEGEDTATEAYVSSGFSVEVPEFPPVKEYVRGNTKIGCWVMRPLPGRSSGGRVQDRCTFQWLFSCDLKGNMPSFIVDTAFATVMIENVQHIRKHAAEARQKGLF